MSTITRPEILGTIEETLTALEPEIRKLAKRWARDVPDAWEDLAQEARVAIYLELKAKPASPPNHLFQRATHKIIDLRKKGKSVDGRLHRTFNRQVVWFLVSLDAPDAVIADRSNLYFKPHQLRPVEDLALALVAYAELMGRLTEQQREYLSLRLQGYNCRGADAVLGLTAWRGTCLRDEIRKEAANTLLAI